MKSAALIVLVALLSGFAGFGPARAQPQCPIGTTPWVDSWGNKICRRADGGAATVEAPRGQACPTGSHPWVDRWGNKICRSAGAAPDQPKTDYYETSKGCPVGTHPWVDKWGAKVCKSF